MFTSVAVAVLRWSVLMGLLALFAPSVFSYRRYWSLNRKCNVQFNLTNYYQDYYSSRSNRREIFETCFNNTLKNPISNLTRNEQWDCYDKCRQLELGITNQDGTFNLKYMDRVQEEYTKYSNATQFFIKKIVSLLSGCTTEVTEKYKSLKEAEKSKCKLNGLFESCWKNAYWTHYNATKQEVCGDPQQ